MEKKAKRIEATHKISAVYYPGDSFIDLTWEDIETGEMAFLSVQVNRDKGEAICRVVSPCVYHGAVSENEIEELRKENEILKDIIYGFNKHLLKMQADCVKYVEPDNTECGRDWFISRMIYHLDGPEQREIQGKLDLSPEF